MTTKSIQEIANLIANGQTSIGMELGSTRIKTVMIGPDNSPIAAGSHDWENALVDGVWSYSIEDIWKGVQSSYKQLVDKVRAQYAVDMAILGTGGVKGLAEGVDAHGKNSGPAGPGNQWQPAAATGAGGFSLARSAAFASIQFFQAIMQPSRMKAPGGRMAIRKPG